MTALLELKQRIKNGSVFRRFFLSEADFCAMRFLHFLQAAE